MGPHIPSTQIKQLLTLSLFAVSSFPGCWKILEYRQYLKCISICFMLKLNVFKLRRLGILYSIVWITFSLLNTGVMCPLLRDFRAWNSTLTNWLSGLRRSVSPSEWEVSRHLLGGLSCSPSTRVCQGPCLYLLCAVTKQKSDWLLRPPTGLPLYQRHLLGGGRGKREHQFRRLMRREDLMTERVSFLR